MCSSSTLATLKVFLPHLKFAVRLVVVEITKARLEVPLVPTPSRNFELVQWPR